MKFKELGLRTDNFRVGVVPYGLFTLAGIILLCILASIMNKQPLALWWTNPHQQGFFLIVSTLQEFVFRSILQTNLQKKLSPAKAIVIVAFLYSMVHIFWGDPVILLLTFVAGLGWGYLWWKTPNLYLISLSHTALNFLIVYFGFFSWLLTDLFR